MRTPFAGLGSTSDARGHRIEANGQLHPASRWSHNQGFAAGRMERPDGPALLLVSNTATGLHNAILTLCDRLYRDPEGNVVADPFDGPHLPAFDRRHIKTDALYCGPFNLPLESGIRQRPGELMPSRIGSPRSGVTDYELLALAGGGA